MVNLRLVSPNRVLSFKYLGAQDAQSKSRYMRDFFFSPFLFSFRNMKQWLIGLSMFFFFTGNAQQKISSFSVDWKAESLDAPTPDSLARLINANFFTSSEKVRAIYAWITGHIAYNTAIFKPWVKYVYSPDPLDTAAVWPSGDEMVARKVMRKRTALCDGYARLFKTLCDYCDIEAVVVLGYGRAPGRGDGKFRTNHTWNAVKIDAAWYLLDATWASGYTTYNDDFVALRNDYYYLTPPDEFSNDHYPEDLRWTLLPSPQAMPEFRRMPFRSKNFYRYDISAYAPANGIVEAATGDTLRFFVQLKDAERARQTSSDPFVDTADYALWPKSGFAKPVAEKNNAVSYAYVVEPGVEWVHLLYKNDAVLHYRLRQPELNAKNK